MSADPALHPASLPAEQLLAACVVRRQRRSGPGGQHRNKVETGIVLVHEATELRAEATERRSQEQNLKLAIQRLRLRLAVHVRASRGQVSAAWSTYRRGDKLPLGGSHAAFPGLLAEALDWLASQDWEPKPAAEKLQCSASQLIKFVKQHAPAWEFWNQQRRERGLRPLK